MYLINRSKNKYLLPKYIQDVNINNNINLKYRKLFYLFLLTLLLIILFLIYTFFYKINPFFDFFPSRSEL